MFAELVLRIHLPQDIDLQIRSIGGIKMNGPQRGLVLSTVRESSDKDHLVIEGCYETHGNIDGERIAQIERGNRKN